MIDELPRRFEEWDTVDCNNCELYWLNQCDGVKYTPQGSVMPCKSFLATRSVIIPKQINDVQKSIQKLRVCIAIMGVTIILNIIFQIMGWL